MVASSLSLSDTSQTAPAAAAAKANRGGRLNSTRILGRGDDLDLPGIAGPASLVRRD